MMKIISIMVAALFSFSVAGAGFEHGNSYSHITFEGSVTASCDSSTRSYYCSAYGLTPSMYTKLVTAQSLDANKFVVTATHESGKTRTKKGKFKGTKSKAINLWLRTLLQRPLLDMGVNQISYQILKGKTVVKSGSFEVTVDRGERRACRRGYIRMLGDDCSSARVCDEYFRRGYCRN